MPELVIFLKGNLLFKNLVTTQVFFKRRVNGAFRGELQSLYPHDLSTLMSKSNDYFCNFHFLSSCLC
jgi:hypothetical protein